MLELYVDSNSKDQLSKVTLDGEDYNYRIYWSSLYHRWYMDWMDSSSNPLNTGTKIVVGQTLIKSRLFKGTIVALSVSADERPPGREELGKRVKILYLTEEEYPQQVLRRPLDEIIL